MISQREHQKLRFVFLFFNKKKLIIYYQVYIITGFKSTQSNALQISLATPIHIIKSTLINHI